MNKCTDNNIFWAEAAYHQDRYHRWEDLEKAADTEVVSGWKFSSSEEGWARECAKTPTPENLAERKEAFDKMSSEGKQILNIVFNCPAEFADLLTSMGKPSVHKIRSFIQKEFGKEGFTRIKKEIFGFIGG